MALNTKAFIMLYNWSSTQSSLWSMRSNPTHCTGSLRCFRRLAMTEGHVTTNDAHLF